ncbi:1-acyl-sn-glycerol-3-phosphate acyltransferase [Singulisphaera sp. PoT]|uniref:1-acyl-sn-glycerol-3-phosphate acyltransferase n=1 Tax=Singulisphaera sp. PoT TaxID=3411797 RepID=UPI003BF4C204
MKRVPLADELPYRFYPPRLHRGLLWASGFLLPRMLRKDHQVAEVDVSGLERLQPLLDRGDGVLLTPNHPDHADCYMMFDLGRRLSTPFYYMAAYQIFVGKNHWILPRIGVFPVDREGADLTAFKTGVDVLAKGKNPLVIFPEGEIYHLSDRLTPVREGAVAVAAAAVKRIDPGKTIWVVPIALKYRFLDHVDPMPKIIDAMERLETRFTWWPRSDRSLVERIYEYAEGVLGLKEYEYLGAVQPGPLKDRLLGLAHNILDRIEDRRCGKRRDDTAPVRVKELRRACLDTLADPGVTPEQRRQTQRDLHDLFLVIQLFSYPGDYIRESPTLERVAETIMKFGQDFLGDDIPVPYGPRQGILRIGEPIDVRVRLAGAGKARQAVGALTIDLESRIQGLLDEIGPGRPLSPAQAPAVGVLQQA